MAQDDTEQMKLIRNITGLLNRQASVQDDILNRLKKLENNQSDNDKKLRDSLALGWKTEKRQVENAESHLYDSIKETAKENKDDLRRLLDYVKSNLGESSGWSSKKDLHACVSEVLNRLGDAAHKQNLADSLAAVLTHLEVLKGSVGKAGNGQPADVHQSLADIRKMLGPGLALESLCSKVSELKRLSESLKASIGTVGGDALDLHRRTTELLKRVGDVADKSSLVTILQEIHAQQMASETHLKEQDAQITALIADVAKLKENAHAVLDNEELIQQYKQATESLLQQKEQLGQSLQEYEKQVKHVNEDATKLFTGLFAGWKDAYEQLRQEQERSFAEKIELLQRSIDEHRAEYIKLHEEKERVERDLQAHYREVYANYIASAAEYKMLKNEKADWCRSLQEKDSMIKQLRAQIESKGGTPLV